MKPAEPQTLELPTSTVRFQLESVFLLRWNRCSLSIGKCVRFQLELVFDFRWNAHWTPAPNETYSRSSTTDTKSAQPLSPRNCPSRTGTTGSPIPPLPMRSSTGSFTTPTKSISKESHNARQEGLQAIPLGNIPE